jgi:hypothetical protein
MSFLQLVYVSSATQSHSAAEIVRGTASGHDTNALNGVTGILLNYNDNILQVLEGPSADVEEMLARTRADVQHRGMLILQDETVDDRQFPDSRTALVANGQEGTTSVPDLFEETTNGWALKSDAEIEQKLAVLLKTFLSVNSGQSIYALPREPG